MRGCGGKCDKVRKLPPHCVTPLDADPGALGVRRLASPGFLRMILPCAMTFLHG